MTSYQRSAVETPPSSSGGNEPVVIFFTDNGKGMGHLTRMLAVTRRAYGRFRPYFLTLSLGYQVLRRLAVPAEFFPPYHHLNLSKEEWSPLLMMRITEAVVATGARAIVVDHVTPPRDFAHLRRELSGVELIWSRRGLWRPGTNRGAFELEGAFDQVVEPGDLAAPIDIGGSTMHRAGIRSIEPVVLWRRDQTIDRSDARRKLGLPESGRALLLNLSAPDTESLVRLLTKVREVVQNAAGDEAIHLFAPLHPLHADTLAGVDGITFAPVYPVADFLAAFDGAISTAGYNSFHELVASGLPVTFIAHAQTNVDDQKRRARFARLSGRGHWAESVSGPEFGEAIRRMLRPEEPTISQHVARLLGEPRGAEQFADLLAESVEKRASGLVPGHSESWTDGADRSVSTKISGGAEGVVVVDVRGHSTDDLTEVAEEAHWLRERGYPLTPIFVIESASAQPLLERRFACESVLFAAEWRQVGARFSYEEYVRRRLDAAVVRYGAVSLAVPQPGRSLAASLEAMRSKASTPSAPTRRSFHLPLPDRNGQRRSLRIDLPSQLYLPRLLERNGLAGYETSALACWLAILGLEVPGAAFDIGANVGPYAWLAAALFDRPVVAFEPVPELASAARSVAELNGLRIEIETLAIGERDGRARLHLSNKTDSSHSLREGFRPSSRSIEVDLRRIDTYVEANPDLVPHAMKIDTETTEPEVLRGGRRTLEAHRPWLIVEVLAKRSEGELTRVLGELDYHWYRIDEEPPFERRYEIVGDPRHQQLNWLFAPSEPTTEFWADLESWQEALRSCVPRPTPCQ